MCNFILQRAIFLLKKPAEVPFTPLQAFQTTQLQFVSVLMNNIHDNTSKNNSNDKSKEVGCWNFRFFLD